MSGYNKMPENKGNITVSSFYIKLHQSQNTPVEPSILFSDGQTIISGSGKVLILASISPYIYLVGVFHHGGMTMELP